MTKDKEQMTNTINSLTERIEETKSFIGEDHSMWKIGRCSLENQFAIMQGMVEILQHLSQPEQQEKEGEFPNEEEIL